MAGSKTRSKRQTSGANAHQKSSRWWNWVLVVAAMAIVATLALAVGHRRTARRRAAAAPVVRTPVSDAIMNDFATISAAAWSRAGTAGAKVPIFVGATDVSGGKPVVLYIGAGYCPYCAAARWSVIASLSRFGTFSGLTLGKSSNFDVFPNTPTFSFYESHYSSQYIDVQTVELSSNVLTLDGQYQKLQTPTPAQDSLIRTYDEPPYVPAATRGAIPFILVGGRYMWSGSPYSPKLLAGRTQAEIAATLPAATDSAARVILANGNQLTAAICSVDGGKPANVCSEPVIRKAVAALPHKAR